MNNKHDNILKMYNQKLKYFGYSKHTVGIYMHYCEKFLIATDKYYQHLTGADFQNYLNNYNFKSTSQQNQIISAIKFLYEKVLNKKYKKIDFTRPRKQKALPQIIDKEELKTKIFAIQNLKHKTILALAYSTGMRVSEVINLQIKDIDSNRMLILIRNGKGRKDRYVPLSQTILELLRNYYRQYKPFRYLSMDKTHFNIQPHHVISWLRNTLANNIISTNFAIHHLPPFSKPVPTCVSSKSWPATAPAKPPKYIPT